MRKYLQRVSMFDGERSLPVEREVERLLKDDKPVVGVSYHPGKRKWRAYLYRGRKQVAHAWCDTKREAIIARLEMERIYGRPRVLVQGKDVPFRAFPRTVPAPKAFVLDDALYELWEGSDRVSSVTVLCRDRGMSCRDYTRVSKSGRVSNRRALGIRIGRMMTVVEQLAMAGEVRVEHMEEGMLMMAEELSGKKKV